MNNEHPLYTLNINQLKCKRGRLFIVIKHNRILLCNEMAIDTMPKWGKILHALKTDYINFCGEVELALRKPEAIICIIIMPREQQRI